MMVKPATLSATAVLGLIVSSTAHALPAGAEFPTDCAAVFFYAEANATSEREKTIAVAGKLAAIDEAVRFGAKKWIVEQMIWNRASEFGKRTPAERVSLGVQCIERYSR